MSTGARMVTHVPLRRAAALRERAVPASELPTTAGPHPLKMLLHDLCRAVVREQISAADLTSLLAKEEQARVLCVHRH